MAGVGRLYDKRNRLSLYCLVEGMILQTRACLLLVDKQSEFLSM
jgi:hypothetical protein